MVSVLKSFSQHWCTSHDCFVLCEEVIGLTVKSVSIRKAITPLSCCFYCVAAVDLSKHKTLFIFDFSVVVFFLSAGFPSGNYLPVVDMRVCVCVLQTVCSPLLLIRRWYSSCIISVLLIPPHHSSPTAPHVCHSPLRSSRAAAYILVCCPPWHAADSPVMWIYRHLLCFLSAFQEQGCSQVMVWSDF